MRAAPFILLLVVATAAVYAGQPAAKDLVGTWTREKLRDHPRPYFTFRADSTYYGIEGDMIFDGRWKLKGNKLVLWSYIDHQKKTMTDPPYLTVFVINSFEGDVLRVTQTVTPHNPTAMHEVWKRAR